MTDLHATHCPCTCRTAIRLNYGFRADLAWWQEFLSSGTGYFSCSLLLPKIHLYTDASGSWGGAAWGPPSLSVAEGAPGSMVGGAAHKACLGPIKWVARARMTRITGKAWKILVPGEAMEAWLAARLAAQL